MGGKRSQLATAQVPGPPAGEGMVEGIELAELPPFRSYRLAPSTARTAAGDQAAVLASPGTLPQGDLSELGRSSDCT
jgi:hypothetical protein